MLEDKPGQLIFRASGRNARTAFAHEAGGHRWQRVPPTEKRGRVHTSTVTVAVLDEPQPHEVHLDPRDLIYRPCKASGSGGQHVQKNDTAIALTHVPTGITVRSEMRSQQQNRRLCEAALRARLQARENATHEARRNTTRRAMVGSGMRADKRRTVAVQRGQVVDHVTKRKTSVRRYLAGHLEDLAPGS